MTALRVYARAHVSVLRATRDFVFAIWIIASLASDRRESGIHNTSRKNNVRKGLKNLFSAAPKFQKTLKRGVYLASVVCFEDRILVTSDEVLPIVEVDESYSTATLNSDLHWVMKVACTWDDVKSLRQDMDKLPNSNAFHFRSKLLNAVHTLQVRVGPKVTKNIMFTVFSTSCLYFSRRLVCSSLAVSTTLP